MIELVLAALQWLGFVDLSAPPAIPPPPILPPPVVAVEPDDAPVDGHIWIGAFVLTAAPSRT